MAEVFDVAYTFAHWGLIVIGVIFFSGVLYGVYTSWIARGRDKTWP